MWLLKTIKSLLLSLVSVFILSIALTATSSANETDEINEHAYPLLYSLSMLISPFQGSSTLSDPMNDEVDDIEEIAISTKKRNFLFDKLIAFNDSLQRFSQKVIANNSENSFNANAIEDIPSPDTKEVNCQSSP